MKKIISLVLVLTLALLTLCSCSKEGGESDESSVQIKYTYDSAYSAYDASVIRAYEALCDAVVKGEEKAGFNIGLLTKVNQLFYTSFPLSALVTDIKELSDKSGVAITYANEQSVHLDKVKAFDDKINEIVSQCKNGTVSDMEYTVNVYNFVAKNAEIKDASSADTVYSTIMNNTGNVFTYANMFEYLLQQNDIPAYHVIAQDMAGTGWGLSAGEIGGMLYYFDIGTEYYANSGEQLGYFGMTSEDVNREGLVSTQFTSGAAATDASDLKFEPCRSCKSWELKDGKLYVTNGNGITVEISAN